MMLSMDVKVTEKGPYVSLGSGRFMNKLCVLADKKKCILHWMHVRCTECHIVDMNVVNVSVSLVLD